MKAWIFRFGSRCGWRRTSSISAENASVKDFPSEEMSHSGWKSPTPFSRSTENGSSNWGEAIPLPRKKNRPADGKNGILELLGGRPPRVGDRTPPHFLRPPQIEQGFVEHS